MQRSAIPDSRTGVIDMELIIKNKALKKLIMPLSALSKECILNIGQDGIGVKLVDPANISMISVQYPKEIFEGYNVTEDTRYGLEIKPLMDIIKINSPKTDITITTKSVNSAIGIANTMVLEYDGFEDEIALLDVASIRKEPKIPKIDFSGKVTPPTKRLLKILKRAVNNQTSYTTFEIEPGIFKTHVDGRHKTTSKTYTDTAVGGAKALYESNMLLNICKLIKSDTVGIEMATDYPLKLSFDVMKHGRVEYLQAPRVESE